MPFYRDHVYPRLVSVLGDPKPIQEVRQRMIPLAQGEVLEIGVGPGVNLVLYDPKKVSKVYALEPNPGMIRLAEQQRRRTNLKIEFLDLPGERIRCSKILTSQTIAFDDPLRGDHRCYTRRDAVY